MSGKEDLEKVSLFFNVLGNVVRLQILFMLMETKRPLHIKAVAQRLNLDYGGIYRHVKVLERAGLLEIYEVGRSRVLSPKHPEAVKEFIEKGKLIIK